MLRNKIGIIFWVALLGLIGLVAARRVPIGGNRINRIPNLTRGEFRAILFSYNDQIEDLQRSIPPTLSPEQVALVETLFQEIVLLADAMIASTAAIE